MSGALSADRSGECPLTLRAFVGVGCPCVSKKLKRLETVSKKVDSLETDLQEHSIVRNFAASKVIGYRL